MSSSLARSEKIALTAVIITKNAATQLADCLKSLAFCQEIIVVDSGSEDDTTEIANSFGVTLLHQPWLGFGPQKKFAVGQSKTDWVLCLDADERISEKLKAAIIAEFKSPKFLVYQMPRCNRFMGRWLRHGEGYPDFNIRLFNRQAANWSNDLVHEHVVTSSPIGVLQGDIMHDTAETIANYLEKQNRYTTLQAEAMYKKGKVPSVVKVVLSPWVRFFKMYVIRRGWQDGFPGFVHITIGCLNSFFKYVKAREFAKQDEVK